jgi:ATP-dependent Clp protease ATP-binding subunit ClpX
MTNVQFVKCNFCGKDRAEVEKLIVANDAGICNECIDLCVGILDKERIDKIKQDKKVNKILDPVKIKQYLDQFVVGQDQAKMTLAVGVTNHYKRVFFKPKVEVEKSNVLLFGPTGSGKTLLVKIIARYLNVPFVIADATTLTEAGYVGEDVESVIGRLLAEAEYDVERCEQGIVFLDEIDKISRKSESASLTRDVTGEGVQQALLKLVEGTKCKVTGHKKLEDVEVDTSKILFIAGGAFVDLDKIIATRQNGTGMGFGAAVEQSEPDRTQVSPEDFVKFGMIPEFTGRFPVTVYTEALDKSALIRILTGTKNSLLKQMQFYFESDDVELEFTDGAVEAIADKALEMAVGARGLRAILEKILMPYMFALGELKKQKVKKITITEKTVKYNDPAQFDNEVK